MTLYNIELDLSVEDFDKEDVGCVIEAINAWRLDLNR